MMIELSIKDRLSLPSCFPKQGKFEEMILRDSVIKKAAITPEEIKKYSITSLANGTVEWKNEDYDFKVEFDETEMTYLKKLLREISDKSLLNPDQVDLYKKFAM